MFFANGDLGVDVFFVLSGFLISWILLKQCSAFNGDIDVWGFYRGRCLRLWPALAAYECLAMPMFMSADPKMIWLIKELFFMSNFPMGG